MSTGVSYNDQGGAEAAVEAGTENTPATGGSTGAAFGLFSTDLKKWVDEAWHEPDSRTKAYVTRGETLGG